MALQDRIEPAVAPQRSTAGSADERAAFVRVNDATRALAAVNADAPSDLVSQLFGRVASEDLLRYTPREIAAFADAAWSLLAERKPGTSKVRFDQPREGAYDDPAHAVAVIEIVNDDMPFLVDSVMGELTELGLQIRLASHPVFTVTRDAGGKLLRFHGQRAADALAQRESFIHIHVEPVESAERRAEVVRAVEGVLAEVRAAVQDWRAMLARVGEEITRLRSDPPPLPIDDVAEAVQFLEWLTANNFTFLGVRDYAVGREDGVLEMRAETGLGLLRDPGVRVLRIGSEAPEVAAAIRAFVKEPRPLIINKANPRSRVHRRAHLDYIGVKRFAADGRLIGELRIVGLFTSTAYTRSTRSIPYLRRKVDAVLARAGFDPDGHSGKALVNVLENYPRDELFQLDEETLYRFALAIMQLDERPRVRALVRRDRFDRYVSVIVFVPRDRYDSRVRQALGEYFANVFHGHVAAFYPFFPESLMVRVHFIIGRRGGMPAAADQATLEQAVEDIIRTWGDRFVLALADRHPPLPAQALAARYRNAFSQGYRDIYSPTDAVADVAVVERLSDRHPLAADFHARKHDTAAGIGLKVWSKARPIPLSDRVPVLENMGFRVVDERTYEISPGGDEEPNVWFHDMLLDRAGVDRQSLDSSNRRLEDAFLAVMQGAAENDGYNALVLTASLPWREVALVRAISRFLRQIRVPFSQDYMWTTLVRHAGIARDIVRLFQARFDPKATGDRAEQEAEIFAAIDSALTQVESLDEDRILRHFVNAVLAAQRTNAFQTGEDGQAKAEIAIKFASGKLDAAPLPRPLYEIFVYSPRLEGVHLRFGKVARGGIRWSDRPQDFRTEVLGLVKAQQVKNAVIVPVGAKGGFVPKYLPRIVAEGGSRDALQAEAIAVYKLFIGTLLDITDNLSGDDVVPPPDVVRHDGDDPYLVVAADKGTATFSDTANAISMEHGFWLDDAFASGGSAGYDHKRMGITARGAWESVKRHFRELDVDITTTPFTAAGVGDMSGDVFGNGMLREQTIKLVAAFDHRDIFIDPDPDPVKSLAERQRLFDLPRSSWKDYDQSVISAGGGVYPRNAKEVPLAAEARALLGVGDGKVTPQDVMRAILKTPVDLLWFGGIGTYVRASQETDDAAGDRANDPIRVTGADLRCKVIGEGANLGMTQRGRIEAALRGVRLNTDAIDNSAGVNTSDVEVNIKIALARPMRDGRLKREDRNALLAKMTDEVAQLVLRNNYQQSLALSLTERRGLEDLGFQQRLMLTLEADGGLDRTVECLPDEMMLTERRRQSQPLTRPELAVLLAYAKIALYNELLESPVPDDPYLARELGRYFPAELTERFPDALENHRLRREIIATFLANSMINRGGPALGVRIADQTGASAASVAAAFAAVRDSYGMTALNGEIDALDARISGALQLELYAAVQRLLLDRLVWFLRNVDLSKGLAAAIAHYRDGIAEVEAALADAISVDTTADLTARRDELVSGGVPERLARRFANLPILAAAPDIVLVADRAGRPIADVTATYFAAESYFRLDEMARAARDIAVSDYFDRLALDRALDSIGNAERRLTAAMLANGTSGSAAVEAWVAAHADEVQRVRAAVREIAGSGLTLSKVMVAASLLGDLVRA